MENSINVGAAEPEFQFNPHLPSALLPTPYIWFVSVIKIEKFEPQLKFNTLSFVTTLLNPFVEPVYPVYEPYPQLNNSPYFVNNMVWVSAASINTIFAELKFSIVNGPFADDSPAPN